MISAGPEKVFFDIDVKLVFLTHRQCVRQEISFNAEKGNAKRCRIEIFSGLKTPYWGMKAPKLDCTSASSAGEYFSAM